MLAFAARGMPLAGLERDTALSAYLARPDQRSYDLADLTVRYLKRELRQGPADDGQLSLEGLDGDVGAGGPGPGETEMLHARAVLDLAAALDDELEERGGTRLLTEIELPLVDLLAQMERTGIAVDGEHLGALEDHFAAEVKLAAEEAFAVIGKEINLGSPKQLQVVLFDELQMPKTKRTKTGYTTDADALQALYVKTEHPFLLHLLRHRDVSRLRQTIEGLLKTVSPDGRIRDDVQPADRGHRPALEHRPQPAEHPDPHRGGPPDPRGVRRRAPATSACSPPTTARSRCGSWPTSPRTRC